MKTPSVGSSNATMPQTATPTVKTQAVTPNGVPPSAASTQASNTGSTGTMTPSAPTVTTPSEHAGTFMVFKAYADLSYGLVMNAESEMHVGDIVKNP